MVFQHVYHLSIADKIGMVTSCWRQLQTFSTMQLLVRLEDQTLCKPPREAMAACHHEDYRLQSVQPNVSVSSDSSTQERDSRLQLHCGASSQ